MVDFLNLFLLYVPKYKINFNITEQFYYNISTKVAVGQNKKPTPNTNLIEQL